MRKRSGVKRVGHAGTLDPAATGVLPLALGQATRMVEYLVDATKSYRARIQLGLTTDTYDLDGNVVATSNPSALSREAIEAAFARYRGEFRQAPPAFSALKRNGVPLYKLARQGIAVDPEPRTVRLDNLAVTRWDPPFVDVEITCSKGFYVRSLAHDVGRDLAVGGTLTGLVRTRVGSFVLDGSITLEDLAADIDAGVWQSHLWAADEVVLHWPAAILGSENTKRLVQGQSLRLAHGGTDVSQCRAYSIDGDFLALLRSSGEGSWRPVKVFAQV